MKLSDMVISAIVKKGILFEARKVDTDIKIPVCTETDGGRNIEKVITVKIQAEHINLRIEKEDKSKKEEP